MVKSGVSVLDLITEFFSSNSRPRLTGVVDRAFSYLRLTGLKDSPDSFFFFFTVPPVFISNAIVKSQSWSQ
jgi:hypothetical protein